jgi:hypothetical protein
MEDRTDFIAYCIEEYKDAEKMTGKDVIDLFKRYGIIDYIKSCYDALHVMGGLAITADINNLINGIREEKVTEKHNQNLMLVYAVEGYAMRHELTEKETFEIFQKHRIAESIRKFYGVLHTQDLDENVYFAEDVLEKEQE